MMWYGAYPQYYGGYAQGVYGYPQMQMVDAGAATRKTSGTEKEKPKDPFAGKPYEEDFRKLLEATCMHARDFDPRCVALLDFYEEKGQRQKVLDVLAESVSKDKKSDRASVANWKAYVMSLIKKVDTDTYQAFKSSTEEKKEQRRRERKESGANDVVTSALNPKATPFIPGGKKAAEGDDAKDSKDNRGRTETESTADQSA
jgi:hypothetical protein